MTETDDQPRRHLAQRMEFIEWRLFWEGHVNRSDLEKRFDISTPQASVDLRNYREAAGDNIEYNATEKRYVASSKIRPKFLKISANRVLLQLWAWVNGVLQRDDLWFSSIPAVDIAPEIGRDVRPEVLRRVLEAIRGRQALNVRYQSLTSSRWRDMAPHALAFDGHRWHARAWCCEREEFRDFVLTRIERLGKLKSVSFDPEHDIEWRDTIRLKLCPHPGLSDEQRQAIQRDYDMPEGVREIEVRLSMAYYFIKRMNLDLKDLPPARAQISLANLNEVENAIAEAKAAARKLVERSPDT
ncbi:MAG: WYL domain-containing protein [Gammaproteobacteria bacterium]